MVILISSSKITRLNPLHLKSKNLKFTTNVIKIGSNSKSLVDSQNYKKAINKAGTKKLDSRDYKKPFKNYEIYDKEYSYIFSMIISKYNLKIWNLYANTKLNLLTLNFTVIDLISIKFFRVLKTLNKITILNLSIRLANNQIKCILSAISTFKNLTHLSLSINDGYLAPANIYLLEHYLPSFHQLKVLSLNSTLFRINSLTDQISEMPKLQILKLILKSDPLGPDSWSKSSLNFTQLTNLSLILGHSKMRDTNCFKLGNALKELSRLTFFYLDLSDNQISSQGVNHLLNGISELKKLQQLNLNLMNNVLGVEFIYPEQFSWSRLGDLKELNINLGRNRLTRINVDILFSGMNALTELINVNFCFKYCKLKGTAINTILNGLVSLKKLQKLNLNFHATNFDYENCDMLYQSLCNISQLIDMTIILSGNTINTKGIDKIMNAIEKKIQIQSLSLNFDQCETTDSTIKYLVQILKSFNLNELILNFSCCNITDISLDYLISYLKSRNKLCKLRLYFLKKCFSRANLIHFSNQLKNLKSIRDCICKFEIKNKNHIISKITRRSVMIEVQNDDQFVRSYNQQHNETGDLIPIPIQDI